MNYQYYEYDSENPYLDPKKPIKQKKPKKEHPKLKKFLCVVALAVVFGLVSGVVFQGTSYLVSQRFQTENTEETSETSEEATATSLKSGDEVLDSTSISTATTVTDVSDIVDNVMPAIVQVTNMSIVEYRNWFGESYEKEYESAGSGIIIKQDSDYIYIVTNNHVVEGASSLTITFVDESAVEAEVQGTDPNTDLAIVKVKMSNVDSSTLNAIKLASIGSSSDLKVGSSAVVIGNALGYGQSVTTGVISALNREVTFQNNDGSSYSQELIQTDAAVNPGNSGGALLNMNGEVVGIVSAKYSDTEVEGMGYAIPITKASQVIEDLMNLQTASVEESASTEGNGAYLGIMGVDVDALNAVQYHMPQGIFVARVISGTGADKAGLEKKDVITALNQTRVTSMEELQSLLASYNVGDTVELTVARYANNYTEETVKVVLSKAE